jgi:serine/threonine-protein kinase
MGKYTAADRDRWKTAVNQRYLSSRALYDLADAKFFYLFPAQRDQDFIQQPMGQVWQAIAADQLKAVQNGNALETIRFDPKSFSKQVSGTLKPGEGKAYITDLTAGQIVRLNLQADPKILLSIYPPTSKDPAFLDNSSERIWSQRLSQSGYYEFVVVSEATSPITYQLDLTAENVTTTPAASPETPAPESKN